MWGLKVAEPGNKQSYVTALQAARLLVIVYALIMNYDDRFCQIVITVTLNSNLPKIWTTIGHICRRHTVLQLRWFTYLNFDFKKGGWSHEDDMLLCENLKFCAFTTKAKIRVVAWEPTLSATIMIPMSMWELLLSFYLKEEANDYIIHLSTRQCRRRWFTYLNFDFKKGGWSHEDDMLLCEAQKIFGNRWTEIAKRITSLNLKFCAFTTKAKIRVVAWEHTVSATIMIPMSMWELLLSFVLKEEANDYIIHLSTRIIQSKGVCEVPFTSKEIVVDFYNELKSITSG
ncbi:hypothetical protein LXL04_020645 [Taraxacum kok-saghyz]